MQSQYFTFSYWDECGTWRVQCFRIMKLHESMRQFPWNFWILINDWSQIDENIWKGVGNLSSYVSLRLDFCTAFGNVFFSSLFGHPSELGTILYTPLLFWRSIWIAIMQGMETMRRHFKAQILTKLSAIITILEWSDNKKNSFLVFSGCARSDSVIILLENADKKYLALNLDNMWWCSSIIRASSCWSRLHKP